MPDLNSWGPMTVLMVIVTTIAVGVGGAVVIFGDGLSFEEYLNVLWKIAVAIAGTAFARGVRLQGTPVAAKRTTRRRAAAEN